MSQPCLIESVDGALLMWQRMWMIVVWGAGVPFLNVAMFLRLLRRSDLRSYDPSALLSPSQTSSGVPKETVPIS